MIGLAIGVAMVWAVLGFLGYVIVSFAVRMFTPKE